VSLLTFCSYTPLYFLVRGQVGNPVVMEQDPIWRQFLLFCVRNGLFYGDPCGVLPKLAWDPKCRIVRCRPETAGTSESSEVDENLVIIGTLEQNLRRDSAPRTSNGAHRH
jgi:hypothetical protein